MCGTTLDDQNRSNEHVFPKWIQRRFNLWNEKLTLLNGTLIPYRQLTIPCCTECNSEHLSQIESQVEAAFAAGMESVATLDRRILFLWLAKIYYGLIFRELFLPLARSDPKLGPIATDEQLKLFRMHHMLLQGTRGVVRWRHPEQQPASIFVFKCQTTKSTRANFDYFDIVQYPYLAIRVGPVGVMSVLQDWGALEGSVKLPQIEAARSLDLHPIQFRQVAAIGAYMSYLFNRVPKHFLTGGRDSVEIVTMPLGGLAGGSLYNEFKMREFGSCLAFAWQVPLNQIFDGYHLCNLLMHNNGDPYHLHWEDGVQVIPTLGK